MLPSAGPHTQALARLKEALAAFVEQTGGFQRDVDRADQQWTGSARASIPVAHLTDSLAALADSSRTRAKAADTAYRAAHHLITICEQECDARSSEHWDSRNISRARKAADRTRARLASQLHQVYYYWRQAYWLTSRFPDAELCDVEGLVKLVDRNEIAANDWSLTPSRYVGLAPEEEDEDFDFGEALREMHVELRELNAESAVLAARIQRSVEVLLA